MILREDRPARSEGTGTNSSPFTDLGDWKSRPRATIFKNSYEPVSPRALPNRGRSTWRGEFMASGASGAVARQMDVLWESGSVAGLTDAQLLERFHTRRDPSAEAAFEALVTRHGPMVLGVCRQLLREPNDVDDAFQATF